MKNFVLFCGFSLFLFSNCKKETVALNDCQEKFVHDNNHLIYDGQEIGCQTFFALYESEGRQLIAPNNHCADMVSVLLDCDGTVIAVSGTSQYDNFMRNATYKGIFAIARSRTLPGFLSKLHR
jgi:hypothetical protein